MNETINIEEELEDIKLRLDALESTYLDRQQSRLRYGSIAKDGLQVRILSYLAKRKFASTQQIVKGCWDYRLKSAGVKKAIDGLIRIGAILEREQGKIKIFTLAEIKEE